MGSLKDKAFGDGFAPYPHGPGVKSPHSLESARIIAPKVGPQQRLVLDNLKREGPCTPDESAVRLGISILNTRPRFAELNKLGLITRTGKRRPNSSGVKADEWRALTDEEIRRGVQG